MNENVDHVGKPIFNLGPSANEMRSGFLDVFNNQVEILNSLDRDTFYGDLDLFFTKINIPEGTDSDSVDSYIKSGVRVLNSLSRAIECGKPGQSIIAGMPEGDFLRGFYLNPETGVTRMIKTSMKHSNMIGGNLRRRVVSEIFNQWAETENGVVASEAFDALDFDGNKELK